MIIMVMVVIVVVVIIMCSRLSWRSCELLLILDIVAACHHGDQAK
jgi:hypothetical protein